MGKTSAHRVGDGSDLLMDLLEHEVRVVTLADILVGQLNLGDIVVGTVPLDGGKGEAVAGYDGNLVVVEVDHVTRVGDDRADIACQEMLILANPEH